MKLQIKMKTIAYTFITSLLVGFSTHIKSQDILTSAEAVNLAIEHNYNVQLAEQNIRIAQNNATKENNGYRPTINANVGPTTSFGGSTQRFDNGMTAETRGAFSWSAGAAVNANYTLYDKSRDLQLDQMKERLNLSNIQLRQSIENTILQVYNQYYQIARLSENVKSVEEALSLSRSRKERSELRYQLSQGLKLDVLNAQVDISRDSVNYLNAIQQLKNAKRDLEVVIGLSESKNFSIDTEVAYRLDLTKEALIEKAVNENVNLLLSDQFQQINQLELDIIETINRPTIGSNAGISYNHSVSAPGSFIKSSTNSGIDVGVTLNWNIFDGGLQKVREQNALINMENEALTKEQLIIELKRDIENAWGNYKNALFVLNVEQNSLEINRLNLDRTTELFNAGQASSIEFRQAQLNLLQSETGYNQARYDAKVIELELIYLSGGMMEAIN